MPIAEQMRHERIGIGDFPADGIQNKHPVVCCLEKGGSGFPIAVFRCGMPDPRVDLWRRGHPFRATFPGLTLAPSLGRDHIFCSGATCPRRLQTSSYVLTLALSRPGTRSRFIAAYERNWVALLSACYRAAPGGSCSASRIRVAACSSRCSAERKIIFSLFASSIPCIEASHFEGLPRFVKITPQTSAAFLNIPAAFNASMRSGPGGMSRAASSASSASAPKSDDRGGVCFTFIAILMSARGDHRKAIRRLRISWGQSAPVFR
jgi:hypothetical protein